MGKADRILITARKSCYDLINNEALEELVDTEYENQMEEEYIEKVDDEHILDTANLLRSKLIKYAEKNSYPLCEFLDIVNVENYVRWILFAD